MEAISAGASVLTFLTVALGSTKIVYQTLSSVKDGPENVKRTASAVLHLRFLLEDISELSKTDPAAIDTALSGDVKACAVHLDSFADRLLRLQPVLGERRDGKLWKKFKAFISERELETVREIISEYHGRFTLRMSIGTR